MNHILKLSSIRCLPPMMMSRLAIGRRLVSGQPPSGDDNQTNERQIKETIETNEDQYYHRVKSSFDRLQKSRENEPVEEKRSRLMYQSRKRGISENGLILANVSAQHLPAMSAQQLDEYDKIINGLHNEWDLYYWLTEAVAPPAELASMETLSLLKKFCLNADRESRITQPDLK